MGYCFNQDCTNPINLKSNKFCLNCGAELLLDNQYRAIKLIGQGGFGRTFLAVDENNHQLRVAVKQFLPKTYNNPDKAAILFKQEALQLQELGSHPQIPKLLNYVEENGRQYLIQEFVEGDNLARISSQQIAFDREQILNLLLDLLPVLKFIHDRGIIHRDIKPQNIIRHENKHFIVDFGAAKVAIGNVSIETGTTIGSAEYAAPEQARGKAVFASDIYGLGVTCIHLLTGISPFDLFDLSENCWAWQDYLINPIEPKLAAIIDKAIAPALKQRYASASEMLSDLIYVTQPASKAPEKTINPIQPTYREPNIKSKNIYYPQIKLVEKVGWLHKIIDTQIELIEATIDVLTVRIINLNFEFVKIPSGIFYYSQTEEDTYSQEVKEFWLGRYEIAQEQYLEIVRYNPSRFKGDKLPVENIDWEDARFFCERLSYLSDFNYRLPTDFEWEYAAKAGLDEDFGCGKTLTTELANFKGDRPYLRGQKKGENRKKTVNVGTFPPNAFGLYDMHGNVWEWTASDNSSLSWVRRGGSWTDTALWCRSDARKTGSFDLQPGTVGFRIVCEI